MNITTVQYVSGVPQTAVANINSSGQFDGSDCVLTFAIANAIGLGDTDSFPKPADYPDFLETNCGPTRTFGSWGNLITITLRIDCPVPAEHSTWGQVKARYR